ncbi:MAG TPA: zf-HC2 domain-containing protein [bacterium]|nr:zf-HC2 domain-containing protein [bacterium]
MRNCSDFQILITGYVDHELTDDQVAELKEHLAGCQECRKELERARIMKNALDMMSIKTPEDDYWDGYWAGIYNRCERQSGWLFFAMGVTVLLIGGIITLFRHVLFGPDTPIWVSVGGTAAVAGTVILVVSLIRERIRVDRHERYKDVRR